MTVSKNLPLLLGFFAISLSFSSHVPAGDTTTGNGTAIRLPRDESPHSDSIEWWYYTGILVTGDKETYGFEMVSFQLMAHGKPFYMAHFAITDQKRGRFRFDTRTSGIDQRNTQVGFNLQVGGWRMSGHAGKDKLSADMHDYAIALGLSAQKPMVLQYGSGQMTLSSDNPFYYYSYTRMAVTGTLTVHGVEKPVTGQAWMDHQWGDAGHEFDGWDWFSLRLDDFSEVMLFVVRYSNKGDFVGGTFVEKDGAVRELKKDEIKLTTTGHWKSPHSQAKYPHGWTIQIPSLELDVKVVAVMADQELLGGSGTYWEGLCDVRGKRQGRPIGGHAYVELIGYRP